MTEPSTQPELAPDRAERAVLPRAQSRRAVPDLRPEILLWFVRGIGLSLGVAVVYAFATGFALAGRVLLLIFIAILLASGLEPFIGWLRSHVRLGRGATILVVYAAFLAAVVGIAFLIVPAAINQLGDLSQRLPPFLEGAREFLRGIEVRALATSGIALIDAFEDALRPSAPEAGEVVEAGLTVAEAVISVVSLLVIVFFWLTEHARLQRYVLAFVPRSRRGGARAAWNEIELRLGSWSAAS